MTKHQEAEDMAWLAQEIAEEKERTYRKIERAGGVVVGQDDKSISNPWCDRLERIYARLTTPVPPAVQGETREVREDAIPRMVEAFRKHSAYWPTEAVRELANDMLSAALSSRVPVQTIADPKALPSDAHMEQMEAHRDEGGSLTDIQRIQLAWWEREKLWRKKWAETVDLAGAHAMRIETLEAAPSRVPGAGQTREALTKMRTDAARLAWGPYDVLGYIERWRDRYYPATPSPTTSAE